MTEYAVRLSDGRVFRIRSGSPEGARRFIAALYGDSSAAVLGPYDAAQYPDAQLPDVSSIGANSGAGPASAQSGAQTQTQTVATSPTTTGQLSTLIERELGSPAGAIRSYLQGNNLPASGVLGDVFQNALQYAPDIIAAQGALGPTAPASGGLTAFLQGLPHASPQGSLTQGVGARAASELRALAGAAPGDQGLYPSYQQAFLAPTGYGTTEAQNVRALGQAALQQRNPFFAAQFGPSVDAEVRRRFEDAVFGANQPQNFAQYIGQQLGLF